MAKKLADIEKVITDSELPFFDYLGNKLPIDFFSKLTQISLETNVFIFSGIIRNYFINSNEIRDIDIVLESHIDIQSIFSDFAIKKNSFGGYKIRKNNMSLDLWYLDDTWAFHQQKTLKFSLEKFIPLTAFFNFSAIVYSFNNKKFYSTIHFMRFLRDKQIDVVYKPNANYALCIINSLYYSDKYKLKISGRLKKHILYLFKTNSENYETIQIKHFGEVLYENSEIDRRLKVL